MSEKEKQGKTKKYDEWEIKDAVRTLVQAEEIKQNKELMNLVIPELKKQSNAMEQAANVLYGKNEKEEQQNKKQENKQQQKQQEDAEKLPDNNEQVNGTLFGEDIAETENESEEKQDDEVPAVDDVVDDVDANNATKLAVLENLLNKSVELNCPIDTENKTIQQQIDELTKVIAEKESKK